MADIILLKKADRSAGQLFVLLSVYIHNIMHKLSLKYVKILILTYLFFVIFV